VNPEPQYSRRPTGGRLALVIIGALVVAVSVVILLGAGALHWVNGKRDADGFFNTRTVRIATDSSAVTTESVNIEDGVLDALGLDRVRVRVRSNTGKPVFVGVAAPDDVTAYFALSQRDILSDIELAPFKPTYERFGEKLQPPENPLKQGFWTDQVTDAGSQTLDFDARGKWAIVLMNADASAGVDAAVSMGAKAGIVGKLAWIVTVVGLVVLAFGVLLIVLGTRRRELPSSPAGSAWGA
jgi:uncharacterized membrane protein YidH (DUF202 family)